MAIPKIHLVFTCLVTNIRRDGSASKANRLEYLWRSLQSLRSLPISSGDFYVSFGSEVAVSRDDLVHRIKAACQDSCLYDSRLDSFDQWQQVARSHRVRAADIILLITYEDHENIEASSEEFLDLVDLILKFGSEFPQSQPISILSHFPESHLQADGWRALGLSIRFKTHYLVPAVTPVGCMLVRPKDLESWFQNDFTQGAKLVSTENYFGPSVLSGKILSFIPKKVLFRHIDGYGHVGLPRYSGHLGKIQISSGLIGRSLTRTSLQRIGWKVSLASYISMLRCEQSLSPLANTLRTVFFSYSPLTLVVSLLTPVHLKIMQRAPTLYHLVSMSLSHGPIRFVFITIKGFLSDLRERSLKSPNISR